MKPEALDGPQRLEKSVEIGTLCAFYGGLLTEKQLDMLRLHYEEDLSLGEIAEQFGVSRQNVHEAITRAAQKLRRCDAALGGARRMEDTMRDLRQAAALLNAVNRGVLPHNDKERLERAAGLIARAISRQEGEENSHGL